MWKSNDLFIKLLRHNRFNPIIMSSLRRRESVSEQENKQRAICDYFTRLGFPYKDCYDYKNQKWNSVLDLKPDVIFYQQPYETNMPFAPLSRLFFRCVFLYVPYTAMNEKDVAIWNNGVRNIAKFLFYPSVIHKEVARYTMTNKGKNIVVSGLPFYENLIKHQPVGNDWKLNNSSLKKIIWAPHHSILEDDILNYSNFLHIADDMLELAKKYSDKLQIAFKPHPHLRNKLEKDEIWGKNKTSIYYNEWETMVNTCYVTGEYVDLFKTSDALIHDCSTFTVEYLMTEKPCLFITNQEHISHFNSFGDSCFNVHYKGNTIDDIEDFIEKVVINGEDIMREERISFKNKYLTPEGGKYTSDIIFEKMMLLFGL